VPEVKPAFAKRETVAPAAAAAAATSSKLQFSAHSQFSGGGVARMRELSSVARMRDLGTPLSLFSRRSAPPTQSVMPERAMNER